MKRTSDNSVVVVNGGGLWSCPITLELRKYFVSVNPFTI